ncbi:MAG: DUF4261 domain-containing protein [Lachnospiraceae bacterium]|nr:DUF4261 domain-containing protein [Lachnospiraceae bacterium]
MGFKKKEKVLEQDLTQKAERPGMVFMIHLLMEEMCEMPEKEFMHEIINKHLGKTDCFCHDEKVAGFAPEKYKVHFEKEDADIPPQLMIMGCIEGQNTFMDEIARSQTWNCPESEDILEKCNYRVIATDVMAAGLDYKDRAEMLVDYIEALMEIFPSCRAVVFENSKKMFTREAILNCKIPKKDRFIYYAVNVRFFNIQGGNDMLIDSLGMSTLFLPDLQYHFHGMDPNAVVNHAYNFLSYIFDANNPIKPQDHIDGIKDGNMSRDVQWIVQYEESLIQPLREVIDINMGEYAAGKR